MKMHQTNKKKLEHFAVAAMSNDRVALESLLHPEFTIHEAENLPYGGVYRGVDGWLTLFGRVNSTWADLAIEPLLLIGEANGDEFGWQMKMRGRSVATGKQFETTVFEHWSFRDGKISEVRPYYWDTKLMCTTNSD
ncbi:nuclear transport factor 2 family protein [Noviherbaspirillum sedimenti]|uniref:Nuclear transport factor 2 family protein n=1 Tax=Noviherbaspirillum sedimenti TaxID=2320865 RepID=A0A3A3G5E4_9BURK|nr:nuclear transport factor 2 family protein [Noviherbaspirillum sedimenti]RJG03161.1 nuclear transport factor 2 family protein [Noviherbaspirillum sedimenti]